MIDINPNTQKTNYKYLPAIFDNLTIIRKTRQAGITMNKFQTKSLPSNIEIYSFPRIGNATFWYLVFGSWILFVICFLNFVILKKCVFPMSSKSYG